MAIVQPAPGWWIASDGHWYPPELHPAVRERLATQQEATLDDASREPHAGWQRKPLRYGGTCAACQCKIKRHAEGWHDPTAPSGHKVLCTRCGERLVVAGGAGADGAGAGGAPAGTQPAYGVPGTSTLRDSARKGRSRTTWQKGATGEYLLGRTLQEQLSEDEVVLSNRAIPGAKADIDFIVVASSGVWVIDAKNWSGTVAYRGRSFFDARRRLFVGREDRTPAVVGIYNLVIPVANVIGDPSIPLHPALVFVEAQWSPRLWFRRRPWQHEDVWISPPRMLCRLIRQPGPLTRDQVAGIAGVLDARLAHR